LSFQFPVSHSNYCCSHCQKQLKLKREENFMWNYEMVKSSIRHKFHSSTLKILKCTHFCVYWNFVRVWILIEFQVFSEKSNLDFEKRWKWRKVLRFTWDLQQKWRYEMYTRLLKLKMISEMKVKNYRKEQKNNVKLCRQRKNRDYFICKFMRPYIKG
jgi:hypothetical protein